MKRLVLLFLIFSLTFASCGGEPFYDDITLLPADTYSSEPPVIYVPSGQSAVETFGLAYSPTGSVNPITGTSKLNNDFMRLLYDSLFTVNNEFEAVPSLCESFEYSERTYTLGLKKGVLFSDGSELTAQDVKYTLDQVKAGSAIYSGRLSDVVNISAADEYTVKILLSRENGNFAKLLDIPIIKAGSVSETSPPGTGMYVFINGENPYLSASEHRRTEAPLSRIQLVASPEADLLIYNFELGTVSALSCDPTATDAVVFGGNYEEWSYPTSIMYYLGFNTAKAPLNDPQLRRAISYAIDRELICRADMLKHASPAELPVSPYSSLYDKSSADRLSFSSERFLSLLEELGMSDSDGDGIVEYTVGKRAYPFEISLLLGTDNIYKTAVAERIAEDLRTMGVGVTLNILSWDNCRRALASRNFDIYLGEVKLTSDFNLEKLVGTNGSLNFGGYSSGETDRLLTEFIAADENSIGSAASSLFDALYEDVPFLPILFKEQLLMARRGFIRGASPTQSNVYNNFENYR
ncbi:MAG: ABC transporter substrate-binding protein [Oscillospiraceae bacterium]|jgi:peptide/nickel transport system substrate-binding protein|nr:ABC transporter substrate-binding protein [Oscillospiraceae bacterium]